MALPLLDAMAPRRLARAQETGTPQRFIAFFYPNGTDPGSWNPSPGALTEENLTPCLQDLAGFGAEGIWPAEEATFQDVTVVTGIDHSGVCKGIHDPSMSLSAHQGTANNYTPGQATLDQFLVEHLQGSAPYRSLSLSATGNSDIGQGHISFRSGGVAETVIRDPRILFDTLFPTNDDGSAEAQAAERRRQRRLSLLDVVRDDAERLEKRLGVADKQRLEQYFEAVRELELQIQGGSGGCSVPEPPGSGGDWHSKSKHFIDLTVLAMACDLTRVAALQYSDSWGVHYGSYPLGSGTEALKDWSDHFISHKLDDTDRATDLDGLERGEAMRIANARVVQTSRFKVRRFSYLVNSLKRITTPTGTLLDETLAMYVSENGDGDSHARTNMPVMLAGHVGGFETGRAVQATNQPTGALHASIIRRYGIEVDSYGDPAGTAIDGL